MTDSGIDLSVLTPSYGYAHFLSDAIESVAAQRGITVEHIIQDGGSTDGTVELLESLGERVRWVSEPDAGQSDALNRAPRRARGRWIAWLNADEFYLPTAWTARPAGDREGADVVYGDTIFSDGEGRLTRLFRSIGSPASFCARTGCFIEHGVLHRPPRRPGAGPYRCRDAPDDGLGSVSPAGGRGQAVPLPADPGRGVPRARHAGDGHGAPGFFEKLNRDDGFGREYDMVRSRYGAMRARRVGHLAHGAAKVLSGAYHRQLRGRSVTGKSLRWFASDVDAREYSELYQHCYRGAG